MDCVGCGKERVGRESGKGGVVDLIPIQDRNGQVGGLEGVFWFGFGMENLRLC